MRRLLLAIVALIALSCPIISLASPYSPLATEPQSAVDAVNLFGKVRGIALSDSDIDQFIAPSVTGADRLLAFRLMKAMPANLRGDFIAWVPNGSHSHLVSNNPAILQYARISLAQTATSNTAWRRTQHIKSLNISGGVRPNFSQTCGPAASNTGAFTRDVSVCGMTDGWGFVNVACGSTFLAQGDTGYLYMELTGSNGSAIEGGFQYNNDQSVQAYVRTTYAVTANGGSYPSGFQNELNYSNPGYHFGCGQNLTITHGIAAAANNWVYTMVGQLPSNIDPQTQYVNMNSQFFYPNNYVWLWTSPASDFSGAGTDAAGNSSPCMGCAITKVTSIAQNGGYFPDGSFFGAPGGTAGTLNAINWLEVIFGQYASSCTGQTGGTCQIESSADPSVYYAPPSQYYPDPLTAQSVHQSTGWGPYESLDGIAIIGQGGLANKARQPERALTEPLPPLPCSADSLGNCALEQSHAATSSCQTAFKNIHGVPIYVYAYKTIFSIYSNGSPVHYRETAISSQTLGPSPTCASTTRWSPGEPRSQYGDSNLP